MSAILIVLALIAVFIVIYLYQSQKLHGPFINFLIIIMILLFLISLGIAYTKFSDEVATFNGAVKFGKFYFQWMGNFVKNTGRIAGYVVNQNWGVSNATG